MPGKQFVKLGSGVVGDAAQHVGKPGLRIDAVELGRLDQREHRCGALAAAIGAGEQPGLAADGNRAVILPMSGKRLRSITAGMRCMGAGFDVNMPSGAPAARLSMSRCRPAMCWSWRRGCSMPPLVPAWSWGRRG